MRPTRPSATETTSPSRRSRTGRPGRGRTVCRWQGRRATRPGCRVRGRAGLKTPPLDVLSRVRFDQHHRAVFHAIVEPSIGQGQRALPLGVVRWVATPKDLAGLRAIQTDQEAVLGRRLPSQLQVRATGSSPLQYLKRIRSRPGKNADGPPRRPQREHCRESGRLREPVSESAGGSKRLLSMTPVEEADKRDPSYQFAGDVAKTH